MSYGVIGFLPASAGQIHRSAFSHLWTMTMAAWNGSWALRHAQQDFAFASPSSNPEAGLSFINIHISMLPYGRTHNPPF